MCPHTAVYVSRRRSFRRRSTCCWICCTCVFILLYMCPHATIHESSYYCTCVLILLCPHTTKEKKLSKEEQMLLDLLYMCHHTTIHVSSYYCTCVLILLYMCQGEEAVEEGADAAGHCGEEGQGHREQTRGRMEGTTQVAREVHQRERQD